jgi:hypothetical protein
MKIIAACACGMQEIIIEVAIIFPFVVVDVYNIKNPTKKWDIIFKF